MNCHDHSKIEVSESGDVVAWCATNGHCQPLDSAPVASRCPAYGRYLGWLKAIPGRSPRVLARYANDSSILPLLTPAAAKETTKP